MTDAVSSSDFGIDLSLVAQAVYIGSIRNDNHIGREFWVQLAHNTQLFTTVVELVKERGNREARTTVSLDQAYTEGSGEFGKDLTLLSEVVKTGRKVGADREFWSLLANDEAILRRAAKFVATATAEPAEAMPPTISWSRQSPTPPPISAPASMRGYPGKPPFEILRFRFSAEPTALRATWPFSNLTPIEDFVTDPAKAGEREGVVVISTAREQDINLLTSDDERYGFQFADPWELMAYLKEHQLKLHSGNRIAAFLNGKRNCQEVVVFTQGEEGTKNGTIETVKVSEIKKHPAHFLLSRPAKQA